MRRIYLDVCCLNRPFDDQSQERIRLEAEAVLLILSRCQSGEWTMIGSEALEQEVEKTPNQIRREVLKTSLYFSQYRVPIEAIRSRAQYMQSDLGVKEFDSFYLASAELAEAEVFLTTDDKLIKIATRYQSQISVSVKKPDQWINSQK
ncbi:MAG: PIN domain-containing protein [Synechococcaceae cyanobacterium SM2_3_2]|nr:PIN domain-containing protein [Synechococcaceae cyanobacterium SM2_3_2]